ncbi:MAG TPA: hypothetical protein ENI92_06775 [Bacteroidetes bacterium]|nr:hypothetical protein [Bacteroidota bacterium]
MRSARWLWLILAGTMVILFATACEQATEEPAGPTGGINVVGTWVLRSATLNGTPIYYRQTTTINQDSTGLSVFEGPGNQVYVEPFTWTLDGDILSYTVTSSGVTYDSPVVLDNDRILTMTTTTNDTIVVQTSIRVTGALDDNLVGTWNSTSATLNGESTSYGPEVLIFNDDGTGTQTEGAETDTLSWSVNQNVLIAQYPALNDLGSTTNYTVAGNTLTVTYQDEEGTWVVTYAKETGGEVNTDIPGTWVNVWMEIDGTPVYYPQVATLNEDSTGISVHLDEGEVVVDTFTWWAVDDSFFVLNQEGVVDFRSRYVIEGTRVTFYGTLEGNSSTQILVKETGAHDPALAGRWIYTGEYGNIQDAVFEPEALEFNIDGSFTDTQYDHELEREEVMVSSWSTSGGAVIVDDNESPLKFATDYSVSGGYMEATPMEEEGVQHPVFVKETGEHDPNIVGTWVYLEHGGNGTDGRDRAETIVFDASGTMTSYHYDESGVPVTEVMGWSSVDTLLLMRDDTMTETAFPIPYQYYNFGNMIEVQAPGDEGQVEDMTFVRDPGTQPADLVGTWVQVGHTVDGVEDHQPATVELFGDGTFVSYSFGDTGSVDSEGGDWTASDSYLFIRNPGEMPAHAAGYTIDGDSLTVTMPGEDGVEVSTLVRETGDLPAEPVGTWYSVIGYTDGALYHTPVRVTIESDGSLTTVMFDADSGEREIDQNTWSANGGYLFIHHPDSPVIQAVSYSIDDNTLEAVFYEPNDELQRLVEVSYTFIRETGNLDTDLAGTWTRTGLTVNGTVQDPGNVTLDVNASGYGTRTEDAQVDNFTWSTTEGYLLVDVTESYLNGMEYSIDGDTLTLTAYEKDYTSVETYTR